MTRGEGDGVVAVAHVRCATIMVDAYVFAYGLCTAPCAQVLLLPLPILYCNLKVYQSKRTLLRPIKYFSGVIIFMSVILPM